MFRLWGKMWKDNHMLKDLAMNLTWRTQFGWKAIFLISNAIQRPDFARTVLLNISSLIILKSR